MELEIGVRITRDTGDLTFASSETELVFIVAAHLPGFTKDEIEVAVNEGDSQISIRGGGHIAFQEAVITSRAAITREVSTECFDESFLVPGSVDWDGIDVWFDEEEKILIISVPKLSRNECEEDEDTDIEEQREMTPEEPQVKTADEAIEAELLELEKEDLHQEEEKSKQYHEKPTEKPSQLNKKVPEEQKSEEKVGKEMHQVEEEGSQDNKNLIEELPYGKPKTKKLPEPKGPHQKDGKHQLKMTDQAMEAKRPTKSQETEEGIQKEGWVQDKPATVQKYQKSKDVGLPDKELKQSLHGFKEDEAGHLNGPEIEEFRARELLKPKELSLDLHKQKSEKPALKVPKEMRIAAEQTKKEKEKVQPELRQPEEQEAHELKRPIEERSCEKTRSKKFQEPKDLGKKDQQAQVSAPEQVLEAAQDDQSETDEELKQNMHEGQEDKEPIAVPSCEKPKAAVLPQKEPKPLGHEFHEDEDHKWTCPDKEASKTRMSPELEEKYKNLQQEEEVKKQKPEKPTEKAQKQLLQVAESTKSGENKTQKEVEQIEEQEALEYKKPIIQPSHEEVSANKLSIPTTTSLYPTTWS